MNVKQASEKYNLSVGYVRGLLIKGAVEGEKVRIAANGYVWSVKEKSLIAFLKKRKGSKLNNMGR